MGKVGLVLARTYRILVPKYIEAILFSGMKGVKRPERGERGGSQRREEGGGGSD